MSNNQQLKGDNLELKSGASASQQNDLVVSYGKPVKSARLSTKPFSDILNTIRTGEGILDAINEIRSYPNDKDKRDELKVANLPYFNMGTFSNRYRLNSNLISTQYMIFDYDHLGDKLNEFKKKIKADQRTFCSIISPSGDGLKVICKLDRSITKADEYTRIYDHYLDVFTSEFLNRGDKTKDACRACFLSYDPDVHVNESCTLLSTDIQTNCSSNGQAKKKKKSAAADKMFKGTTPGNRTPQSTEIIGSLMRKGHDKEFVLNYLQMWNKNNKPPLDNDKIAYTVDDMFNRYSDTKYDGLWSFKTEIYQLGIVGEEFYLHEIGVQKFYSMLGAVSKEDKASCFDHLVRHKHIPHLKRVNYIGDVDISASTFDVDVVKGEITVRYAPIPELVKDNAFIEKYLDNAFGIYKQFIKEYLAVYAYTNYNKLPTLVLQGSRGTGKNTFAEMVAEIYKPLSQMWGGTVSNFTPEVEKKLLVADETVSEDPEQYKLLKKYSGQRYAMVNKKYQPPYEVMNNMNVIIMSNGKTPIYVERDEAPADEKNNQFFVYEFLPFQGSIDTELHTKLADRLGHYIRTELKLVYTSLVMDGYRYSISVPITDEERVLFANNATDVELEADRIVDKIVEQYIEDSFGITDMKVFLEHDLLPVDFIDSYCGINDRKLRHKVVKNLKERRYLADKAAVRDRHAGRRYYSYTMTKKFTDKLKQPDCPDRKTDCDFSTTVRAKDQ